jgi:hypothetical protein
VSGKANVECGLQTGCGVEVSVFSSLLLQQPASGFSTCFVPGIRKTAGVYLLSNKFPVIFVPVFLLLSSTWSD